MSDCLSMSPAVPRWIWWAPGACVVEALRTGHFPDTLMVKLPDDRSLRPKPEPSKGRKPCSKMTT